jgi:hypothetical protein
MLEITTNPLRPGSGIGARRKNGDKIYLRGETIRQLRIVRKILMKLSKHFDLPMATFAAFPGLEMINASNDELLACLSTVPNPYDDRVDDPRIAIAASNRDWRICNCVQARDPTIEQLVTVSAQQEDWMTFWRVRHPDAGMRERLAQELVKARALKAENRARLERRQANGAAH